MFQECKMISKYLTPPPAHILHTSPRCLAVNMDVCSR